MIELLESRGWRFSHNCACTVQGKIYKKNGFKVKVLKKNPSLVHFTLKDGSYMQFNYTELEDHLNKVGL